MREAETILRSKLDKAVTVVSIAEVHAVWNKTYEDSVKLEVLIVQIQNLYREDLFYADRQMVGWSAIKDDSTPDKAALETFSDKMSRLFPDYVIDEGMHIRPKPEAKRLNFGKLIEMLRSKDEALLETFYPLGEDGKRGPLFLDGTPLGAN